MSEHTPGPWRLVPPPQSDNGNPWRVAGGDHTIAIVPNRPREANARLITAAPEMYDMLQRISAMADPDFVDEHNPRNVQAVLGEIMKMADRCIAKAVGRTP